nr:rna-binding protein rnc1 [Quercus suber]
MKTCVSGGGMLVSFVSRGKSSGKRFDVHVVRRRLLPKARGKSLERKSIVVALERQTPVSDWTRVAIDGVKARQHRMLARADCNSRHKNSRHLLKQSVQQNRSSKVLSMGQSPKPRTGNIAEDQEVFQKLPSAGTGEADGGNIAADDRRSGQSTWNRDDFSAANDFDLTHKQSAEIERKRLGAQPEVQFVLDLEPHQRRYTTLLFEQHLCELVAALEFQEFVEEHRSHCLLLEGRRTTAWPRVPLYAAASFVEWQECESNLMLTWFATYHDRTSVQAMLKSLIGQLIDGMHEDIRIPRPEDFLREGDLESTASLLQLFRLLLEDQLGQARVFLTIEGIEQYQLPGPESRKPELDKFLNCLSTIIAQDSEQSPRNYPLKLLLTAHYKFLGTYTFAQDRYTRLDVRKMIKRFELPTLMAMQVDREPPADRPFSRIGVPPDADDEAVDFTSPHPSPHFSPSTMSAEDMSPNIDSGIDDKLGALGLGEDEIPRTDEEYGQAQVTLRAIVTSKEAGVIIGKAGANVADLRDKTGVRAGVSKVVPGVHDRVLTVTGALNGIAEAYGLVADGLVKGAPQMGMGGIVSTPNTHPIRLLISHNQMGTIIGRQGLKIKQIQDASGVRMVAQKEMLPQSTERIVEVQGTPDGVQKAVWEIGKCLVDDQERGFGTVLYSPVVRVQGGAGGAPPVNNNGTGFAAPRQSFNRTGNGADFTGAPQQYPPRRNGAGMDNGPPPVVEEGEDIQTQNISIPADMVGCIIGRGGSKISEIRKSSGARISIAKAPHDDTGERMFTITGGQSANEKALYLLYENLEAEKMRRSQTPEVGA